MSLRDQVTKIHPYAHAHMNTYTCRVSSSSCVLGARPPQVTAVNLALVQLQTQLVFWDSLSIVRRRTPVVKMQIAKVTEDAILMVVNTHTTAASNTITSVEKSLAMLDSEDKAEDES